MKIKYEDYKPGPEARRIIARADMIGEDYANQGYDLTLRQLFYQFVSREWLANTLAEYNRLKGFVKRGRLAGMIDWDHIVDRTRTAQIPVAWDSPAERIRVAAGGYREDRWADQPYRVEVWVEKEALAGVLDVATADTRTPWFSCRGYTSSSSIWGAAQRLRGYIQQGQIPVILYLGDHDPSGIDMTRDIKRRLHQFMIQDWLNNDMELDGEESVLVSEIRTDMAERIGVADNELLVRSLPVIVNRIALNMDQIDLYALPPNPAKFTDSRAAGYIAEFGRQSWELDALEPRVLDDLIADNIEIFLDRDIYEAKVAHEVEGQERLALVADELEAESGEEE